jgi:(1->4)-alpha-D-glucan 1-alpha-D-glucosylmutase
MVAPHERTHACLRWAERIDGGEAKLWTIQRALSLRRDHPELFRGDYLPVHAAGSRREHIVAFAREEGGRMALCVAPRFTYTLLKGRPALPLGDVWGDTELLLPPNTPSVFENVLSGEMLSVSDTGTLRCRDLLNVFPCALLSGQS